MRRLGGRRHERPVAALPRHPRERGLGLRRGERGQHAATTDCDQEEQTPARGPDDELGDGLQVAGGFPRHECVDLQRNAGGDDALGGGQRPAEAAEHAADGIVAGGDRAVETQRHRLHTGILQPADRLARERHRGARRDGDAQAEANTLPHEVEEVRPL